jgi:penicillin-binding protein 1C
MQRIKSICRYFFIKHRSKTGVATLFLILIYYFSLPSPLFDDPTSKVLEDRSEQLLGARIATDGQWRFPHNAGVPEKFAQAIIEFEDRRFYNHLGIDPVGIGRAIQQNFKEGAIVSGGSTINMQVIRMARKGKSRNIFQKLIEMVLATRLELKYSKDEILAFYASNAPFGGNVVGLDAAAWRYYGKPPKHLTWSEAATLAVLPNAPALIHPGRNRQALEDKRNRLLDRLLDSGAIDQLTNELAKEEALPEKPLRLPMLAPHLMDRAYSSQFSGRENRRTKITSTLDRDLQQNVNRILDRHHLVLKENHIHNLAAIVVEVESGNILAYTGNVKAGTEHHEQVDVIKAPRSTGSILKPFLYAMALNDGSILPNSLLADVPTRMHGYHPKNFYETYDGVVPASRAVSRSLNVPMVRLLSDYGLEKFHFGLQKLGFSTINRPPDHYGLTLVLGGAEATLEDITNAYVGMARSLNHFYDYNGKYSHHDFRPLNFDANAIIPNTQKQQLSNEATVLSAATSYQAFEAMQRVERPNSEGDWQQFHSSIPIAWKTGTSYGFRDAWAVGVTPKYAVGIWVGNADGEGRPGLVGVRAAAPVLFDVFDLLDGSDWFDPPYDEMVQVPVCKQSGMRALENCTIDSTWIYENGLKAPACSFHQIVHLDRTKKWRVNASCEAPSNMIHEPWFVLPPLEEHYFKSKNPNYKPLPPYREDCEKSSIPDKSMQMIYPKHKAKIYIPRDLGGARSKTVFKVAHRKPESIVYWHLDNNFVGQTQHFHEMELAPEPGQHILTLVDETGSSVKRSFEILRN